ncbi:MAG TPA: peptidoglycan DD-metalloendopeptidase family protein [Candidatus Elarobacter sp.]|jgi:murein DD-endopeptidase MepM/ murein hydrolase activator NlpD|nr:peptidoglycan DD-metalloendopeptidase family protein [Candidatus Elarobacter sp.]
MMLRRALAFTLAAALLPTLATAKSHIDDKIQAQKAHIHAVHAKLDEKRSQLSQAKAKVGSISAELEDTNRNIASVTAHLGDVAARVKSTQRKLDWNKVQLAAAQATLRRHEDVLSRRLVDAYEHGDLGYVDVLLRARSFGDFVERWNDVRYLIKANEATIRARKSDEKKVLGIQGQLLGIRSELQTEQDDARRQQLALDSLAVQRRQLLAAADQERRVAQTQVNELEEESAAGESQLEALIQAKQEEEEQRRLAERRARQLAGEELPPEPGAPGQLAWPASGPITSPFGMRVNPVTHVFTLHAGIDIGVPTGTTVAAAADGKVIIAGWDDGGCGNYIILDHGGRLSTQYCHLSHIFVGVGQVVQRGQAIAASGSTGNSTGPHLHFGVRINGRPVDPMSYLR